MRRWNSKCKQCDPESARSEVIDVKEESMCRRAESMNLPE
ncbi:hypothetical protein RUMOBE_03400 [Blautia obeum ATCC 29174]|uniref:Uncharacterized protein n=1 Tax=Blautia obeum ATCC 29174 TaxID=411459 RepID=A5ZWK7_9FIRM|nr:hypothetical protein RUMOBE_03400 [Blautia obeum ATCC 29174]